MKRLSIILMVFSLVFTVFIIAPPFLGYTFGLYPLMDIADVFDLFTPLVLMPLYWLIYRLDENKRPKKAENIFFMIFAAVWILGQAMHLTANSIGHLLEKAPDTAAYSLTYFYDEVLSHYLWHFGTITLSALLIYGNGIIHLAKPSHR